MNKVLRKRIVDKHRDSLLRFGDHPNALYWSSARIQELRFQVLSDIGVASGDAVLDVGCGFADLNRWFDEQGLEVTYTGLDISPHLIEVAKEKHSTIDLLVGELFECAFSNASFDWILLSGALNEPYADEGKYTYQMITKMYVLARKGVAFNLLNAKVVKAHDLQSFNAGKMLQFCQTLSASCQLREDYLDNDFTIYMRK